MSRGQKGVAVASTSTASARSVCAAIASNLQSELGAAKYAMWFEHGVQMAFDHDHDRLDVLVSNRFAADCIARNMSVTLADAAEAEIGRPVNVQIEVDPTLAENIRSSRAAERTSEPPIDDKPGPRPSHRPERFVEQPRPLRHRLDTFIVGPSNELAYTASVRFAESDDPTAVNPLFVHGGCGLGKTHLLQGICQRARARNPHARIEYVTAEQFTNQYITATRAGKLDAFRRKVRQLDLLAVDDVHFLANKQATQNEFLHSFDAIDLSGARLVLASDSHPRQIQQFSEALMSRCLRGMVVQVHPPDAETRRRVIHTLAARRRVVLKEGVLETLADRPRQSVRELEGTITKLHALATLGEKHADVVTITRSSLDRLSAMEQQASPQKIVHIDTIVDVVCRQLSVTRAQVLSKSRQRHVVLARALITHLARRMTTMSYPEIAQAVGRTNHSTVITAAQRIDRQLKQDEVVNLPGEPAPRQLGELIEQLHESVVQVA